MTLLTFSCAMTMLVVAPIVTPAQQPPPTAPAQPKPPVTAPATVPPGPPATAGQAPRAAAGGGVSLLTVDVTDKSGNPIPNVQVGVAGPVDRSGTTGKDGSVAFKTMRTGLYRLRFEVENF